MKKFLLVGLLSLFGYQAVYAQAVSFAAPVNYTTGSGPTTSKPMDVAIADFNSDTRQDIVTANPGSGPSVGNNNISVLPGNGNGTFAAARNFTAPSPREIAVGNFNADTKPDVVVVGSVFSSGASTRFVIAVFINTTAPGGLITFAAPVIYDAGTNNDGRDVAVGKFNADNFDDIAITNRYQLNVLVFLNNGSGGFPTTPTAYTGVGSAVAITTGDINGDNKRDLITTDISNDNVSVLIGSGTGTFTAPLNYQIGDGPRSVTVGRFNGDAYGDVAVFSGYTTAVIATRPGTASGALGALTSYNALGTVKLTNADFNLDGKVDIAASTGQGNSVGIYLGSGTGTFASGVAYSLGAVDVTNRNAYGIAVGNFNVDTKPDVVVTNVNGSNVTVLLNTTVPANTITTGSLAATGYCAGSSIVVPYTTTGTFGSGNVFRVQLSEPSGSFNNPTNLTTLRTATGSITVGIPGGTTNSSTYRVRVVSSNPVVNGTPNPANIRISSSPVAAITVTTNPNPAEVCPNTPVTMTASSSDNLTYTWSPSAGLNTTTGATVIATPSTTTAYTVKGSNGICSRTVTVTITVYEGCRVAAVADWYEEPAAELTEPVFYPNPATDRLTIKSHSNEAGYIEINNVQGQLVRKIATSGSETQVNLSGLPASMYMVSLVQGNKRKNKLIQVTH